MDGPDRENPTQAYIDTKKATDEEERAKTAFRTRRCSSKFPFI